MATETAPHPRRPDPLAPSPEGRPAGDERAPETLDLTGLGLRPAPEAEHVEGLLEVEADRVTPATEPAPPPDLLRGAVSILGAVLIPLVVLLVVLSLPVGEVVQGALLAAGWVGLAVGAHLLDVRQRERR